MVSSSFMNRGTDLYLISNVYQELLKEYQNIRPFSQSSFSGGASIYLSKHIYFFIHNNNMVVFSIIILYFHSITRNVNVNSGGLKRYYSTRLPSSQD